jgi:hypothetical protein
MQRLGLAAAAIAGSALLASILAHTVVRADQGTPATGRVTGVLATPLEPLSAEPRFRRFEITLSRVLNADTVQRIRDELVPYEQRLAAAAPGSGDQVEAAATLALNFARIGDARRALPAARIAAAGADALWASDPQTAGFAYASIAQMHGYLGHLLDAQRVASDGKAQWRAAHPATPEQTKADYADGSRFLLLERVEAQAKLLRVCRANERLGRNEKAWLEESEKRTSNRRVAADRKLVTPLDLKYPLEALQMRACGFVIVRYANTPAGATRNVETLVLSGPPIFSQTVESAVLAMTYEPSAQPENTFSTLTSCIISNNEADLARL